MTAAAYVRDGMREPVARFQALARRSSRLFSAARHAGEEAVEARDLAQEAEGRLRTLEKRYGSARPALAAARAEAELRRQRAQELQAEAAEASQWVQGQGQLVERCRAALEEHGVRIDREGRVSAMGGA